MNLQQLIYFEKVAELEHYTRAAEELHITQPCMSHAISELERELGVPLFYKKGRNVKLTRFGTSFHEHVSRSLEELDAGVAEIRNQIGRREGKIFLTHISSMYIRYIPYVMTNFFRDPANLSIKLEMQEAPTGKQVELLKDRRIDLGFGGYVEDPELQFDRIYTERLAVIVGKDHPLAGRESISMAELSDYNYIAYDPVCSIRKWTDSLFEAAGVETRVVGEYVDNNMVVGMVACGDAFAIVPEAFGSMDTIRKLTIEDPGTVRDLYMISIKNDYHTPLVEDFMEFIRDLAERNDY